MFNRTKINDMSFKKDFKKIANSLIALLEANSYNKDEMNTIHGKTTAYLKQIHAKSNKKNYILRVAQKAKYQVNRYLHKKPWHVIGIGTAIGLFLGKLLSRY